MKNDAEPSTNVSLRAAVRRAVDKIGGVGAASSVCRARESLISRYQNPNGDIFIPLDVAAEIDSAADDTILREWAQLRGFELVKRNALIASECLATDIGAAAEEFGELANAGLLAVADGKLTPREGRELLDAASDVEDKIVDIKRQAANAMAGAFK